LACFCAYAAPVRNEDNVPLIGVGDRLKLIFYGRTDISGEYTVQVGGTISIPLLGQFDADGKMLAELSDEILKSFLRDRQEPAQLVVEVAEWRPVYMMGLVDKPGEYPFKPGMTAMKAIAAAGGFYRPANNGMMMQVVREAARVAEAKQQLARAQAKKLRLQAEISNINLVGADKTAAAAADLDGSALADQVRVLNWSRGSLQSKIEGASKEIDLSTREVQSYKRQLEEIEQQIKLTKTILNESQALADRGLSPRLRVVEIQRIVAGLQAEREQANASLYRAERSRIQAEQEQLTLEIDHKLLSQQALGEIDDKIATLQAELRTAQYITSGMPALPSASNASEEVTIRIVRRGTPRAYKLPEAERVQLMPGDLLVIERTESAATDAAAPAPQTASGGIPVR
jgi:protein involved in polysaccharide export with SLBB domain